MEEYLLRVGQATGTAVADWLMLPASPSHVRLATMAPLSAYGYPPGAEGCLLRVDERGIVVGVEDRDDVPRDFIPWHNVSYLTDGAMLAGERGTG
jgi:hypothetical protein